MPKGPKLNIEQVWSKLRLALRSGAKGGGELAKILGISQPAFSLLVKAHKDELFITGKTKSASYALPRQITGLPPRLVVYAIDSKGKGAKAGILTPIYPADSFHWEGAGESKFYSGLPYFLEDLRPSGYLGALLPSFHPELNYPKDITKWNTDQCLVYLARFGFDLIGNYILGEEAYSLFLQKQPTPVPRKQRLARYIASANDVLALGDPGSSAAGEQPKFLISKEPNTMVLVKFSPKKEDARAKRFADLLWCEYLALQVLKRQGFAVAEAEVLENKERTFLEVERFDRTGDRGRRPLICLRSLDLEFVGIGEGWVAVSESLLKQKKISVADFEKIQCLDLFGALIANSDRHLGNLSFFVEAEGTYSLAPVYDMLPMNYIPKIEVVDREFRPPVPTPAEAATWRIALPAAIEFWKRVEKHESINREFRAIAKKNRTALTKLEAIVLALPD